MDSDFLASICRHGYILKSELHQHIRSQKMLLLSIPPFFVWFV
jgi:hypothetical protein